MRSIAKGITWRVIASVTTVALVYLFTGDLVLTLEIGALDVSLKLLFYYLHERAWIRVRWGREIPQEIPTGRKV